MLPVTANEGGGAPFIPTHKLFKVEEAVTVKFPIVGEVLNEGAPALAVRTVLAAPCEVTKTAPVPAP